MIRRVSARWFRGITDERSFELGALTLLSGRNGLGKTTFFDAIDWGLFGSAWRLGADEDAVRNIYFSEREPEVEVQFVIGDALHVVRRQIGKVYLDGELIEDRDLAAFVARDVELFTPYSRDIPGRLRRVLYLSQGDMRVLVQPESLGERDALIQALVGVPEAAAARSGIRRVEERLNGKRKGLLEELARLREQLEENERLGGVVDSALLRRASEHIKEAHRLLGDASTGDASEILRALREARAEGDRYLNRLNELRLRERSVSHTTEAVTAELIAASEVLEQQRLALGECSKEEAEARDQESVLRGGLEAVAAAESSARRELEDVQQRLTAAQRLVEHRAVLELLAKEVDQLRDETVAQSAELQRIESTAVELRERLSVAQEARSRLVKAVDLSKQIMDVQVRLRELEGKLAEGKRRQAQLLLEDESIAKAVAEARSRHSDAEKALKRAMLEADAVTIVHDAVNQILPALKTLNISSCPVCNTTFPTARDLVRHAEGAGTLPEIAGEVEELRKAEEAARGVRIQRENALAVHAATIQETRRDLDALSAQVNVQLQALKSMDGTPTTENGSQVTLAGLDEEIAALREARDEVEATVASVQAALETARVRLSAREEELERVKTALSARPSDPDERIDELQVASAALEGRVEDVSLAGRDLRGKITALLARIGEIGARKEQLAHTILNAEQAIKTKRERLDHERQGLREFVEEMFPEGTNDWQELLTREQIATEKFLERVIDQCSLFERLAAAERFNLMNKEVAGLRLELIRTEGKLAELELASGRFEEVSQAVQHRASEEAKRGIDVHKEEIQACLDAIYPHPHLNEIVDLSRKAVMVSDHYLKEPVRADLFQSTGQINVVGLAFFLGVALHQRSSRIRGVLLDEPIQNLDDLNFLGLVTLLKRVALSIPVVISTADTNAAEVIRRQVVSTWAQAESDFRWYHWDDFGPLAGPTVMSRSVQRSLAA